MACAAPRRTGDYPAAQLHPRDPCCGTALRMARPSRGTARGRSQLFLSATLHRREAMTVAPLWHPPEHELAEALDAFERSFTYPLGNDRRFRITHDDDYAR